VIEVGAAARTACIACVRPLGPLPLLRRDVAGWDAAPPCVFGGEHDPLDEPWPAWPALAGGHGIAVRSERS
jgi:hypothetical protein